MSLGMKGADKADLKILWGDASVIPQKPFPAGGETDLNVLVWRQSLTRVTRA